MTIFQSGGKAQQCAEKVVFVFRLSGLEKGLAAEGIPVKILIRSAKTAVLFGDGVMDLCDGVGTLQPFGRERQ